MAARQQCILLRRRNHTDCGKHITLADEARNPGYYMRTTKRAESEDAARHDHRS